MAVQENSYSILMASLSYLDFRGHGIKTLLQKIHGVELPQNAMEVPDEELSLGNGLQINRYEDETRGSGEKPCFFGLQHNEYSGKAVLLENSSIDCLLLVVTDTVLGTAGRELHPESRKEWQLDELLEALERCSAEASEEYRESTLSYYLHELHAYCDLHPGMRIGKIMLLSISDNPDPREMTTCTIRCANAILEENAACRRNGACGVHLYLDTNGGLRDFMTVLIATMRLVRNSGIRVGKAYYAAFNGNGGKGKDNNVPIPIIDKKDTYEIFDLVSGSDEFVFHGKVTRLRRYFGENHPVLTAVEKFSIAAQYCNPDDMIRGVSSISNAINTWMNSDTNLENEMLRYVVCRIRDDFGEELMGIGNNGDPDAVTRRCLIPLIRWCAGKQMIQQAVTLYTEKMPDIIVGERILYYADSPAGIAKNIKDLKQDKEFKKKSEAYIFIENYLNLPASSRTSSYRKEIRFQEGLGSRDVYQRDKISDLLRRGMSDQHEIGDADRLFTDMKEGPNGEDAIDCITDVLCDYFVIKNIRNSFNHAGGWLPNEFRNTVMDSGKSSAYINERLDRVQDAAARCR